MPNKRDRPVSLRSQVIRHTVVKGMIMKEGAFALIDCLGFKGIWKRTDPSRVIDKLQLIEQTIQDKINSNKFAFLEINRFGPLKLKVNLLSDTVAFSLQYEHD